MHRDALVECAVQASKRLPCACLRVKAASGNGSNLATQACRHVRLAIGIQSPAHHRLGRCQHTPAWARADVLVKTCEPCTHAVRQQTTAACVCTTHVRVEATSGNGGNAYTVEVCGHGRLVAPPAAPNCQRAIGSDCGRVPEADVHQLHPAGAGVARLAACVARGIWARSAAALSWARNVVCRPLRAAAACDGARAPWTPRANAVGDDAANCVAAVVLPWCTGAVAAAGAVGRRRWQVSAGGFALAVVAGVHQTGVHVCERRWQCAQRAPCERVQRTCNQGLAPIAAASLATHLSAAQVSRTRCQQHRCAGWTGRL